MKTIFSLILLFSILQPTIAQNVGIGTTNPVSKLHVNGTAKIDSGLTLSYSDTYDPLQVMGPATGVIVDQFDLNYTNKLGGGTPTPIWQSFTPGLTAPLDSIALFFDQGYSNNGQLRIYEGEGTGGTMLAVLPVGTITNGWNRFIIPHIPVTAGRLYTIYLNNPTELGLDLDGNYPRGRSSIASNYDINFKTWLNAPPALSVNKTGTVDISSANVTLATPGGTPSLLNHYEETRVTSNLFNGPNIFQSNYTAFIIRVGKQVTITFPVDAVPLTVNSINDIVFTAIPARFRPANNLYFPVRVISGGTNQLGLAYVRSDGDIYIKPNAAGTSWGGANSGIYAFSVSYVIP